MPLPDKQLTPEELAALLNQDPNLVTGADRPQLPVAPVPPKPQMASPAPEPPPPPPDPNDPHNQYMAGADQPPPAQAPLEPRKSPEDAPKAPETPAAPPKAPEAPVKATAGPGEAKVVSTAPDWYEAIAPPETSAVPGVIGGVGLGILGALLARKNPGIAAGMGGLGALTAMQSIAGQPQREFDNRLSAAERQAAMTAKLQGGGDSAAELERLRLAQERLAMQKAENERKAAEAKALGDMNSPETVKEREIAANLSKGPDGQLIPGGLTDAQLAGMNGADIRRWRTALQNQASQARGMGNAMEMHDIRTSTQYQQTEAANAESDRRAARDQGLQVEKENREQVQLNEQALIPGYRFTGKRAPNIAAVEKARGIADQTEVAEMAAENMVKLWQSLETASRLAPAWAEGALTDEQRSLVNEIRAWGLNLDTAQRQLALMGVPQVFEMEIMRTVSPDATGIRALLNNGSAWAAQKRVLGKLADKRMSKYGYTREVAPEETQAPSSGDKPLATKLQEAGDATKPLTKQVTDAAGQVVKNATNTAQQVAGDVVPALKKIQVFNVKSGQWVDAQKAEAEIQATIDQLKQKGLDPSKYIRMVQ